MENQFLKVGDFMDAIGKIKIIMHTGKYDLKKEKILNGEIIEEINIHNIIVNSASKILANCLAGKTGFNINNVKLGTISNQNENHKITNLSSANTINIDINEKFFVDKNGQYVYDNEKDINDRYLISGIAFCAEKNSQEIGNEIKEMGLFSNNLIFSYKKMKECLIPPNTEISIIWKIIF